MMKKVNKEEKNKKICQTKNMNGQTCNVSAGQKQMWLSNLFPHDSHIVPSAQSPQMAMEWTISL